MLVGTNEHRLAALGLFSPLCDQLGADFIILGVNGITAIQRKEVNDLVASLHDHRMFDFLTKRTEQVAHSVLIIEGDWDWDRTGTSRRCRGFTEAQYRGLKWSMQFQHNVIVEETRDLEHTASLLPRLELWLQTHDAKKSSLLSVQKQPSWGDKKKATALRVLQCVPGVSLGMASRLYDALGLPVALTCTDKELSAVPGFGKVRVAAMKETFGGSTNGTEPV